MIDDKIILTTINEMVMVMMMMMIMIMMKVHVVCV